MPKINDVIPHPKFGVSAEKKPNLSPMKDDFSMDGVSDMHSEFSMDEEVRNAI